MFLEVSGPCELGGVSFRWSFRPHELSPKSAKAFLWLKRLAGICRGHLPEPFGGLLQVLGLPSEFVHASDSARC